MAFEPVKNMMKITSGKKHDAWRISLPKDACRHLGWNPGDAIHVSVTDNMIILMRKVEVKENDG